MKKLILTFVLISCSKAQFKPTYDGKKLGLCPDKPNCVSTQDDREQHALDTFELSDSANLDAIEQVALTLPGSKTASKTEDYLRIECTSRIMRFVDDLELKITDDKLIVRSESRTGHSDFGVNRKRAEQLRASLKSEGLTK